VAGAGADAGWTLAAGDIAGLAPVAAEAIPAGMAIIATDPMAPTARSPAPA